MTDNAARRTMMVDTQVRPSDVTRFPIIQAMLTVQRQAFVPNDAQDVAYAGAAISLAPGRAMLEPRVLAKMLEALEIGPDDLVLNLGAGLGYGTAVVAHMAEAVVALEEDEDLAKDGEAALSAEGVDNAVMLTGALTDGNAKNAPYDAILIEGGVEMIPDAITDQLKIGGRIGAIFMDGALGEMRLGTKTSSGVSWRMDFNATAPVLPGFAKAPSFVF